MPLPFSLQSYDSFRGISVLGTLWTLRKGARAAACVLKTHPLGWEPVVSLGADLAHSQVVKERMRVLDLSEEWS